MMVQVTFQAVWLWHGLEFGVEGLLVGAWCQDRGVEVFGWLWVGVWWNLTFNLTGK